MLTENVNLPALLKPKEAAAYLGVSPQKLERDRWCDKRIPYVKMGRHVRYRAVDLIAYVNSNVIGGSE